MTAHSASKVKDIIEAASVPLQNWYSVDSLAHLRQGDREFIATFDPEHVALMEAVCEAATARFSAQPTLDFRTGSVESVSSAVAALIAYRTERGLS